MLSISREADYAVRLLVHMAGHRNGRLQAKAIAKEELIPTSFLFKILQTLAKFRVVRSYRGVGGGYQLSADPAKLTLYDVLEMVEGPLGLNLCVMPGRGCELTDRCGVHDLWVVTQAQLRKALESVTIGDLAARTQKKRSPGGTVERDAKHPPTVLGP